MKFVALYILRALAPGPNEAYAAFDFPLAAKPLNRSLIDAFSSEEALRAAKAAFPLLGSSLAVQPLTEYLAQNAPTARPNPPSIFLGSRARQGPAPQSPNARGGKNPLR